MDRTPPAFSGRLVYSDAQGQTKPVAGTTVTVLSDAGRTTLTTDAGGDFSGTGPVVTAPTTFWAVSAVLGGLLGAATARIPVTVDRFPSRVTGLAVDPAQPYRNQSVTISGRLEYQDASGTWRPAPNSTVHAVPVGADPANYLNDTVYWATSGSDGTFRFSLDSVPESGAWTVTHDPELGPAGRVSRFNPYAASHSDAQVADPAHLMFKSSISLYWTSSPCAWVVKGRPTKLLGALGGAPLGEPITVQFSADDKTWTNTPFTGTNGAQTQPYVNFSIPVDFVQTGWWRASYAGSAHALPAVSSPLFVTVDAQYRVSAAIDQGLPATPGAEVHIRGGADGCSPTGDVVGQTGDPILLQFSTDRTTWKTVQTTTIYSPDGSGNFAAYVQANTTGYWRTYATKFKTASSPILVTVKRAARFTGLSVSPTPARHGQSIHLTGVLQGSLYSWYALAGRKVQIFFRAKGAKTATQIGVVTTGKTGTFAFTTTARQSGTYSFTYPGSGLYWPVNSLAITVTVK